MKNMHVLIISIMTILCVEICSSPKIHAENKKKPHTILYRHNDPRILIENDEILLGAYARMMRYQLAAQDYENEKKGVPANPTQYMIVGINNIEYGKPSKLHQNVNMVLNQKIAKNITLERNEISYEKDVYYLMYMAKWNKTSTKQYTNKMGNINKVTAYTTYDVEISYQSQKEKYIGIILYRINKNGNYDYEIIDPIIPQINNIAKENMPPVRSPWGLFISSSAYEIISEEIREKIANNEKIIPDDAPIGFLPGDDVPSDDMINGVQFMMMSSSAVCDFRDINNVAECNPSVIAKMLEIWSGSVNGTGNEVCFSLFGTPECPIIGELKTKNQKKHCNATVYHPTYGRAWAVIEVHPNGTSPVASADDRNNAINENVPYWYTLTSQGSYRYTTSTGATDRITKGLIWQTPCP
jgi:hypothetical protein